MEKHTTFVAHKPHKKQVSERIFFTNTHRGNRGVQLNSFTEFLHNIAYESQSESYFSFEDLDFSDVQKSLDMIVVKDELNEALEAVKYRLQHFIDMRKSLTRIRITKPQQRLVPSGQINVSNIEYFNRVDFVNFRGEIIASGSFDVLNKWDDNAINLLNNKGAFVKQPDMEAINNFITEKRKEHPEFSECEIENDN